MRRAERANGKAAQPNTTSQRSDTNLYAAAAERQRACIRAECRGGRRAACLGPIRRCQWRAKANDWSAKQSESLVAQSREVSGHIRPWICVAQTQGYWSHVGRCLAGLGAASIVHALLNDYARQQLRIGVSQTPRCSRIGDPTTLVACRLTRLIACDAPMPMNDTKRHLSCIRAD